MIRWLWIFLSLFGFAQTSYAKYGDVTHIVPHKNTKVVTDPSKGWNAYRNWGVFPDSKVDYRKVVLFVTYKCPDSLHCGEWDYIDDILLRRVGGAGSPSKDVEIARMISPYGWRFGSTWGFTWHVDITDFAFLLHDSVEVEFNHSGYEANNDRGWLITLDFELVEGKPAMKPLGLDTLWHGSFPYGDTSKPIENLLHPIEFSNRFNADVARLRICQTGHGMDDSENCAEFCDKYRKALLDDSLVDQRQIWRKCGTNPLYPQAGTWIFNRANWCPGSMVFPDDYDFPIKSGSKHNINIDMEPYTNLNHPTASYVIYSYLLYYKAPWAGNDVSFEEILSPSKLDEYSRQNPICSNPTILIKNSGAKALESLRVKYGVAGGKELSYDWRGELSSQKELELTLPGAVDMTKPGSEFMVRLESPNNSTDEYPLDNTLFSTESIPAIYGTKFVLAIKTNNDSLQNSYQLLDSDNMIVRERKIGSLKPATSYRDTFDLRDGCYQLIVNDTSGDGLDFWLNPDGGYGYVRLLDMDGHLLKSFISDFGSEIRYSFVASSTAPPAQASQEIPIVNPFPIRSNGVFNIDIFFDKPTNADIRITSEDSSRVAFDASYVNLKDGFLPVDISSEPDGFYILKVIAEGKTTTRKIKIKHKD